MVESSRVARLADSPRTQRGSTHRPMTRRLLVRWALSLLAVAPLAAGPSLRPGEEPRRVGCGDARGAREGGAPEFARSRGGGGSGPGLSPLDRRLPRGSRDESRLRDPPRPQDSGPGHLELPAPASGSPGRRGCPRFRRRRETAGPRISRGSRYRIASPPDPTDGMWWPICSATTWAAARRATSATRPRYAATPVPDSLDWTRNRRHCGGRRRVVMQTYESDVCVVGGGISAALICQKLSELAPGRHRHRPGSRGPLLRSPGPQPESAALARLSRKRLAGRLHRRPGGRGHDFPHHGGGRVGPSLGRHL